MREADILPRAAAGGGKAGATPNRRAIGAAPFTAANRRRAASVRGSFEQSGGRSRVAPGAARRDAADALLRRARMTRAGMARIARGLLKGTARAFANRSARRHDAVARFRRRRRSCRCRIALPDEVDRTSRLMHAFASDAGAIRLPAPTRSGSSVLERRGALSGLRFGAVTRCGSSSDAPRRG
ncbi:hypothetical protein C7S16_1369 [Burkholderia thailandensis]|uniref:Uncharacterized protein n=1 Tax=Burkholderia thailandensis TaxID=57975 RepID=A0AAW9D0C2_BURTH|nr:hypothetical protein [Burkholderia thailandensis]MDW9256295.1 hypothetical protein [Burkholderia thailandensis]